MNLSKSRWHGKKSYLALCPKNKIDSFNVETGDGTMGAGKIRRGMVALPIHSLASAEERGPFGQVFVSTLQNDSCPSRKVSAPLGRGETTTSFWQAQRAAPRLRGTV
jgi:hypothetical protein